MIQNEKEQKNERSVVVVAPKSYIGTPPPPSIPICRPLLPMHGANAYIHHREPPEDAELFQQQHSAAPDDGGANANNNAAAQTAPILKMSQLVEWAKNRGMKMIFDVKDTDKEVGKWHKNGKGKIFIMECPFEKCHFLFFIIVGRTN